MRIYRRLFIIIFLAAFVNPEGVVPAKSGVSSAREERRLLYVATPGIRNYVEYGGVGILVFDISHGHRFVKRIPTWKVEPGARPENIKGIAANAGTGKLYLSTPKRVACLDLFSEKIVWEKEYPAGSDRMALSPDGKTLYVPSFEGPVWYVVDAVNGELTATIETKSGAHNTIYAPDGRHAYLAGLRSPLLSIADTHDSSVVRTIGPFGNFIRPFTINGRQTLCFLNVNDLLGFEVGDILSGRMLYRVEVAGYQKGAVKRHGCPSHGIGLTPDERELWLCDAANMRVHVFDATVMPPRQKLSIKVKDQPGWITFSIDGRFAYPSTGDVIDTRTKQIVATLKDETGQQVQSEKLLEIDYAGEKPIRAGNQFGLGGKLN